MTTKVEQKNLPADIEAEVKHWTNEVYKNYNNLSVLVTQKEFVNFANKHERILNKTEYCDHIKLIVNEARQKYGYPKT